MRLVVVMFIAGCSMCAQEFSHNTEPRVAHKVEPAYTKEALDAKIEGEVVLTLMIGADGVPSEIKVVRGLGKGLDGKAVECLQRWRFIPATDHGEPVATRGTVEMSFRLPPGSKSK